jgi:F0F1-type ATP synthase assembly protein I
MNQALKIYIAVMAGILVGLSLGDWLELLLTK